MQFTEKQVWRLRKFLLYCFPWIWDHSSGEEQTHSELFSSCMVFMGTVCRHGRKGHLSCWCAPLVIVCHCMTDSHGAVGWSTCSQCSGLVTLVPCLKDCWRTCRFRHTCMTVSLEKCWSVMFSVCYQSGCWTCQMCETWLLQNNHRAALRTTVIFKLVTKRVRPRTETGLPPGA